MQNRIYLAKILTLFFVGFIIFSCQKTEKTTAPKSIATELRAPAYPLITVDPYFSAWSSTDQLFDDAVRHWTGRTHSLIGALRVDGKVYRFLGKEEIQKTYLLPMAGGEAWEGKYINEKPQKGWEQNDFNHNLWETGKGAFGTDGMSLCKTLWETEDIWVRREFTLPETLDKGDISLIYSHDDIFELYLNGKKLVETEYEWHNNVELKIDRNILVLGGKNVIAAHCHNRTGGGYVDFGLIQDNKQTEVFQQTAIQNNVALTATQTHYSFTCGPIDLKLQFVSPLLPSNLDLLSRPVNYIDYQVAANDGKNHDVEIYFETTPEWAVHEISQEVIVEKGQTEGINFIKAGTTEQPILEKKGDNVRIDWGYFYLAASQTSESNLQIGDYSNSKKEFAAQGKISSGVDEYVTNMAKSMPVMAFTNTLGEVSSSPATGYVMLAYDDLKSIQYFGDNKEAWWTKNGTVSINDVLKLASNEHNQIVKQCNIFDKELLNETMAAGGKNYADLCILAFRQSIAAHKLIKDNQGNIIFLSKENFSNGSVGTVDLTYPSAPLYLKYNVELLKGMMNPIFYYSESGKWTKPFAAHDVGTYPQANGQTYGGDMPIEESGNMLVLMAAIAKTEGNAEYAKAHWEVLSTWANYLMENGLDPENQLCTDDFSGHFAHNTNLSVKAIMGIAAYGYLAEILGKTEIAEKYTSEAKSMAQEWMKMADDGDHYRLTFDKPGTWSQKYNLVWDKIIGLGIFPEEVAQKEIAYYLTKQNKYGLPLDNRETYTKSDWIVWTAALANDTETFQKFIDPLHAYVTETPNRVPMSDWYNTNTAEKLNFQARSVVGAYFIKLLETGK